MKVHIIEGEAGCRFAAERPCAAVVVDALRASATAAALLEHNAEALLITRTVADAFALKERFPDALLYGERGGVPPDGFDYGNSPEESAHASGKRVVFTTTTGAGRLLQAGDATPILMGTTVNAVSVVQYLLKAAATEVVLIPAGLMDAPEFDAQEDRAAAAYIAMTLCERHEAVTWGAGHDEFLNYRTRIAKDGLEALFLSAPHADKLRAIDREADVYACARTNIYAAVPVVCERHGMYAVVRDGHKQTHDVE